MPWSKLWLWAVLLTSTAVGQAQDPAPEPGKEATPAVRPIAETEPLGQPRASLMYDPDGVCICHVYTVMQRGTAYLNYCFLCREVPDCTSFSTCHEWSPYGDWPYSCDPNAAGPCQNCEVYFTAALKAGETAKRTEPPQMALERKFARDVTFRHIVADIGAGAPPNSRVLQPAKAVRSTMERLVKFHVPSRKPATLGKIVYAKLFVVDVDYRQMGMDVPPERLQQFKEKLIFVGYEVENEGAPDSDFQNAEFIDRSPRVDRENGGEKPRRDEGIYQVKLDGATFMVLTTIPNGPAPKAPAK